MNAAIQPPRFTAEQIEDIAKLFASSLTRGNIVSIATSALGRDALPDAANDLNDSAALAKRLVQTMHDEERLADAVALLRREAHVNGRLMLGLNRILQGRRLGDDAAAQAFVNEYEPFISSASVQTVLPRVIRSVCAVWLGAPHNTIVGTGFLIGPEYVLTNYHVIEPMLTVQPDGKIVANAPGSSLYFIFDYLAEPPPKVPPPQLATADAGMSGVAVRAADDWLVHARKSLEFEGTPRAAAMVDTEYDYAVVKLATPVGLRPCRNSGGAIRGWLTLPDQVEVMVGNKRIMLFQHPGAAAQQFDIGDFIQADVNRKRVWYSVSAAKGSSGGAAVGSDGAVFALHNSEVQCPPAPAGSRVNQGVRIDVIRKDLLASGWAGAPPPDSGAFEYWSLSDDVQDPRPIIGRGKFREYVRLMSSPADKRVLVVTGPAGSGVRFSVKLLRRLLSPLTGMVVFSRSDLETLTPEKFLRTLVNGLDMTDLSGSPIPPAPPTESMARWLRLDLPKWLAARVAADEQRARGRYPAWIVFDAFVSDTQRLLWADNLKELVAALAGAHDPGQASVDLPQLRWVFLVGPNDTAPVANVDRNEDDLREQNAYDAEFADCVEFSWRCVDRRQDRLTRNLLETIGRIALKTNTAKPPAEQLPARKALAIYVRDMFLEGRPGSGP